ncbi:CSN-associated deubiquitinating enzyme Ubp12 [Ascosphaera pollenicola]|nr:CSN-associated deubiquitinating enzyme Ubp12 [Ascosphaera pollenicola]
MFNRSALAVRQWSAAKPETVVAQLSRATPGCLRSFSSSQARKEDEGPSSPSTNPEPKSNVQPRTFNNTGIRARFVPSDDGASKTSNPNVTQKGSMGPILKAPKGFKLLQNLKRTGGGGGMSGGGPRGPRGPGGPRKMDQRGRKGAAGAPRRRKKEESYGDEEDEYANLTEEQQEEVLAKIEAERPKPLRYNPKGETIESLLPTWPALPIGDIGQKQTVVSRLDSMGARFANGFEAPSDLARRLLEGKMVHFRSEEEKAKTLEIAQEMAQEKAAADGEEAQEVQFSVVDEKVRKQMLDKLIAGDYSKKVPAVPDNASPALRDAVRLLKNNESYQEEDVNKFIALLNKTLPPVAPRPAKP